MISSSCGGYLQADVVSSDPWLRVSQSHVASLDGRHEIEFDVDTPNLRPYEQYSGQIRVHTNIGSREIPVTVLIEFKQLEDISRYGGRILSGFLKDKLHGWHVGPDSPKRKLTSVPPWALILALLFHEDEPQSAVGKRDGKTISLFGVAMALIVLVGIIAIVAMFMARSGQ